MEQEDAMGRIFIASTMALSDVKVRLLLQNGVHVVCSDSDVARSIMAFLQYVGSTRSTTVVMRPATRLKHIQFLFKTIRKSPFVVVTHECCWPELDIVLACLRPPVLHSERIEMSSFTRLSLLEILGSSRLTAAPRHSLRDRIVRVAARLVGSVAFQMKQAPGLAGRPDWVAWVPRTWLVAAQARRRLIVEGRLPLQLSRTSTAQPSVDHTHQSLNVLMVVSRGHFDVGATKQRLVDCIRQLSDAGFGVTIKDHIREGARLNLMMEPEIRELPNVFDAPSEIPAEVLCHSGDYLAVVGIQSAALGLVRIPSFSILPQINPDSVENDRVRAYLEGLPSGGAICFAASSDEIVEALLHRRRSS